MSDSLNNKELVAVGHHLAKVLSSDTPIIDIAKMLSRLAERLDCTTAALREMTKQRDALAAMQQPAVDQKAVESLATDLMKRIDKITGERHSVATLSSLRMSIVEACRAAMLQGAEPVSQPDELPMDYLQGHKDGLEWAARLAEANHPQTGDWLYDDPLELAKAIRKGPDMPTAAVQGWIPCSERMPVENDIVLVVDDGYFVCEAQYREGDFFSAARGKGEFFETTCRDVELWMPLPAAPQQEEPNRIQEERVKIQEEMAMGARLTKHRFKVK